MGADWVLDKTLEADTVGVTKLKVCEVRLMNDRRFPWLILVPMRAGLADLHDLTPTDYTSAMDEVRRASLVLASLSDPIKMNVASLGNAVRQLHIHVVARRIADPAWPKPIWGQGAAEPYADAERDQWVARIRAALP